MMSINKKIQARLWGSSTKNLLPGLSAGLVIGLLSIFTNISFAAILFSGDLAEFVARGIGLMLLGAVFFALVGLGFGTFSANVMEPQDGPVAVLSVISVSIVSSLTPDTSPEEKFLTVVAVIIITSLTTGIFFYLLGQFNLGNIVRYIPFPVMGGFLAGAGWLLTVGSIGVMVDVPFGLELLQPAVLVRWVPGLIFAISFLFVMNRYSQFWVMPVFMVASTLLCFVFFELLVGKPGNALADGWLLGPFPEGELWKPFIIDIIPLANWRVVLGHLTDISTIVLVSAITFLLNLSAISVGLNKEIDMNRELKINGVANMIASLGGFSVGYSSFSSSIWGYRLSGGSGLVTMVVALISGITFFAGASLLNYFPRIIAGGLLLFWGLSFIQEYLIEARNKLPRLEYLLMWVIVFIVALVGFLEGVLVGILIAVVLFGVNYSRTRTVRLTTTAANYQSQVQRPILYQQLLKQHGDRLLILSLQGHIFFGSASNLFDTIAQVFEDSKPEYAVLDFRLVTGIDSSAMLSIAKIKQLAEAEHVHLVFTDLDLVLETRLVAEVLSEVDGDFWHIFPDLDEGLAWCENQLLERFESTGLSAEIGDIRNLWADMLPKEETENALDKMLSTVKTGLRSQENERLKRLTPYIEHALFEPGDVLVEEEDCFGGLIMIESGQVMSQVLDVSGVLLNMKLFNQGAIVGVAGCYAKRNTILSVIATESTEVYLLTAEKIAQMERDEPDLAIALHRLIASQVSERILYLDDMVQALQF